MVEEATREPTVQEIVVALRETTGRGRGRGIGVVASGSGDPARPEIARSEFSPSHPEVTRLDFSGRDPARLAMPREAPPSSGYGAEYDYGEGAPVDIADLRDAEIERLLAENRRLNERVVYLLKVIEREQEARRAADTGRREERETVAREVRGAVEAELKPVLITVLRLLENLQARADRQRAAPAGREDARAVAPAEPPPEKREIAAGYHSGWIPDLIRAVGDALPSGEPAAAAPDAEPPRPRRGLFGRFVERLKARRRDSEGHDEIA